MSDVEQRELPDGWVWTTIGEVTTKVQKVKPADKPNEEIFYLDISSIDNQTNRVTEPKVYLGKDAPSRARQLVKANDVLFSTVRTYLKNIALVPPKYDSEIASTGFSVLRSVGQIPGAYLFYFTLTNDFLEKLGQLQRGVSYPAVRDSDVRSATLPIASLAEQRRIVAEIETLFTQLDAGIATLSRTQRNLQRYKASVLKAACEGRLVPQDESDEPASELLQRIESERRFAWEAEQLAKMRAKGKEPKNDKWKAKYKEPAGPEAAELGALPAGWVWARLGQVCEWITKGTTPKSHKLHDKPSDEAPIPFLKVYNLTFDGMLDFNINPTFISEEVHTQELARSIVLPGDVLMNIVGPPLGKVSVVPPLHPEWNMNQAIVRYRPILGLDTKFLSYLLLTESILIRAKRRAKATAGQFNLTLKICRELPIPLPPLAEQRRIVAEVERRLSLIAQAEAIIDTNLKRAARLRQSILKRAFEGKLVAQDESDEPASALLARIQAEKPKAVKKSRKSKTKKTRRKKA